MYIFCTSYLRYESFMWFPEVSLELSEQLAQLSASCGVSLHATLLTAWMLLLSRHAEEEDVCVGTPLAARSSVEAEETVGYFVTPLAIRCQVVGSLEALLKQVAVEVQRALAQPRMPLQELCEELNLEIRRVLQAMFIFQSCPKWPQQLPSFFMGHEGCELRLGDLILESMAIGQRHAQFDLALMMALEDSRLIGSLQYASRHYQRSAVVQLQSQFVRLLQRLTEGPPGGCGGAELPGAQ